MNARRFLDNFGVIAESPNGVALIRTLIVDLATSGRLVEELDDIRETNRRAEHPDAMILPTLPASWSWVSLASTGRLFSGDSTSASEKARLAANQDGIPYIATKDVGYGRESFNYSTGLLVDPDDMKFKRAASQSVFLCLEGGSAGRKMGISDREVCFGNKLLANETSPDIIPEYILCVYQSTAFQVAFRSRMSGIIGGIAKKAVLELPVPLPRVEEQARIVARVDDLMALCDVFAERRSVRTRRASESRRSVLHALISAGDPDAVSDSWKRIEGNWEYLLDNPKAIDEVRDAILALAVQGHLTPNVSWSESADEEILKVLRHKKEAGLRRLKAQRPLTPDEMWFRVPAGWSWARWEDITDWITYGFTRPMPHENDGIPIVTGKNVIHGEISWSDTHKTSPEAFAELSEKDRPVQGDLLLTKDGSIGRTAIVQETRPFCINQSVAVLWLRSCHFDRRFLQILIDSPQVQAQLLEKTEGVAVKHISVVDFGQMAFPVPPLPVQHQIVRAVDELMLKCESLETALNRDVEVASAYAEAICQFMTKAAPAAVLTGVG